jgi:hypothetical protein
MIHLLQQSTRRPHPLASACHPLPHQPKRQGRLPEYTKMRSWRTIPVRRSAVLLILRKSARKIESLPHSSASPARAGFFCRKSQSACTRVGEAITITICLLFRCDSLHLKIIYLLQPACYFHVQIEMFRDGSIAVLWRATEGCSIQLRRTENIYILCGNPCYISCSVPNISGLTNSEFISAFKQAVNVYQ